MSLRIHLVRLANRSTRPGLLYPHAFPKFHASLYSTSAPEPQSTLGQLTNRLTSSSLNHDDVHVYYPRLVQELKRQNQANNFPTPLTKNNLFEIISLLSTSGRSSDIQRIIEILTDMDHLFGIEPTIQIHTFIINRLIKNGNAQVVHNWLLNMPSLPGHIMPTRNQFHTLLVSAMANEPFDFLRHVVSTMRKTGCKPSHKTYHLLIDALWAISGRKGSTPPVQTFASLIEDMRISGLWRDEETESLLYDMYANRGMMDEAVQIRNMYNAASLEDLSSDQKNMWRWNSRLSSLARSEGLSKAIAYFGSIRSDGCTPSFAAMAILRQSKTTRDLFFLEKELDFKAQVAHWSLLINNNVRNGHIAEALSIYEESKKANILPDAGLVSPIMKALCRPTGTPSEGDIDQAFALYRELSEARPAVANEQQKTSNAEHSRGPDQAVYRILLSALSVSKDIDKWGPLAMSLLDDMKSRNISMDDSDIATSLIVLLMRQANSSSEALEAYAKLQSSLDEKGYAIVLNAFCSMSFGDSNHIPSIIDFFRMVRDMRNAGRKITAEVYTILLHQLAVLATKAMADKGNYNRDELLHRLIATVRRVHHILTLDASVSPDAHLWNQLMDTYQRLGCFQDSLKVWDMMFLTGRFDQVSVSIILDACAWAGAWPAANEVCVKLLADNFVLDEHNWNTWLECLCRLGRLTDAVKMVCLRMGKAQGVTPPNVESARILLKFARKTNRHIDVLAHIKRHQPDLWGILPDDLRAP